MQYMQCAAHDCTHTSRARGRGVICRGECANPKAATVPTVPTVPTVAGRCLAPPNDRSHTQLDAGGSSSPASRPLLPRGGGAEGVDETVWARVGDLAGAGGREVVDP
jgi:hypothetical protein